jgi:HlyD family secretion protein
MTRKNIFRGAVVLALLALLGYGMWRAAQPTPETFQGQMEAQETDIAPKVTGRIGQILVKEGDHVQVGTLLLHIDSPEIDARYAQASAAKDMALAGAKKAQRGARPQEIEIAKSNWQRAAAAAELAEVSFLRLDALARDGLVALQKRDEAQSSVKAARAGTQAALAQYELARAGARVEDRDVAQAQVRQVVGVVAEVDAARIETELKSPVAGEVAKLLAKSGELSPQGVAVVSVVDLNDQWVVLNVREDKLQRFALGSEFLATLPALGHAPGAPAIVFKVYFLGVMPDFATWRATRSGQGFDARSFEVRARPLTPISGARPGMSVIVL